MDKCDLINSSHLECCATKRMQVLDEKNEVFFNFIHSLHSESDLVDFDGNGRYGDPKLVWVNTAGSTAVKFLDSIRLGDKYENNMFIGDVHNGRIYHFELTQDRKDIVLPVELSSRVIEDPSSPGINEIVFGEGFGGITDLEVGPDGNLYVVSIGLGSIFQIGPKS